TSLSFVGVLQSCHSERSEESRIIVSKRRRAASQRCFASLNMTRTGVSFFGITNWIFYSGFTKAFKPQQTGIAFAAGETFWSRIVTTVRERKIDTQLDGFVNYFSFGKFDKWCVNLDEYDYNTHLS